MTAGITIDELRQSLEFVPRYPLAHLPTPLEPLRGLSKELGGPTVWIKRDDCTGLTFGGNKTRHNEYLMGDALAKDADMFVWGAGLQSNNCRQTAAACAKAGLDAHLVLSAKGVERPIKAQGNLLLDQLVGAAIEFSDAEIGPELDDAIEARAAEYREKGRKPYAWNRYEVKAIAAIGYVPCLLEIMEQSQRLGFMPKAVYICSAGSTGSGLILAAKALGVPFKVHCIAPIVWPWDTSQDICDIANNAGERLRLSTRVEPDDFEFSEDYIGPGYDHAGEACLEALQLTAQRDAVLLDPVYSGKAMSGLIDHIRKDRWPDGDVVFVHTGGTPALFALNDELAEGIPRKEFVQ